MSKTQASVRLWIFIAAIFCAFGLMIYQLYTLQIRDGDQYATALSSNTTKKIVLKGSRGFITDSESTILAKNKQVYNVTFYRKSSQNSAKNYQAFTDSVIEAITIIEQNGGTLCVSSPFRRNEETGEWEYYFGNVSESASLARETLWRKNHYLTKAIYDSPYEAVEQLKARYQLIQKKPDGWTGDWYENEAKPLKSGISEELMLKIIAVYSEMQQNLFNSEPVLIAKDVAWETVIEIETRSAVLSGVGVSVTSKRIYPRGSLAAQVIGYTGAIDSETAYYSTYKPQGYALSDSIGKDGIEKSMESWLTANSSARQGYRLTERDSTGAITRTIETKEPEDGYNVKLTINSNLQQVAERVLAENIDMTRTYEEQKLVDSQWLEDNKDTLATRDFSTENGKLKLAEKGALVAVDMSGNVLAMASWPTYDLNALTDAGDEAAKILLDTRSPLMNYAIQSRGAPGSIFKMCTGMAGLLTGALTPTDTISDGGYFTLYNQDVSTAPKCWISPKLKSQHADLTIVTGISNSCNYFFYTVASRLGADGDVLYKYSSMFGLTSKTGINLPGEIRSIVGSQEALYDTTKAVSEYVQDTSIPQLVFNKLRKHIVNFAAIRGLTYDDERLDRCVKRLMDMAVNSEQGEQGRTWIRNAQSIAMEELGMPYSLASLAAFGTDIFRILNDVKWGGQLTIMTAIGQAITLLTPVAVVRYIAALANGGTVYNLNIVDSITTAEGEIVSTRSASILTQIEGAEEYLPYIKQGMKGVVDEGTAKRNFSGWKYVEDICAKTGSAENSDIDLENNSWFVAFGPYETPAVAMVAYIPNGYSGARSYYAVKYFMEYFLDNHYASYDEGELPAPNSIAP